MESNRLPSARARFPATRWSVVVNAQGTDGTAASEAWEDLCRAYWKPIYCFIRQSGFGRDDAEDLVQAFFSRVIERDLLAGVSNDKGKLRTWLLALLKPQLLDRRKWDRAKKRGGNAVIVSIDADEADRHFCEEPVESLTPEALFERKWAMSVLARALESVEAEFESAGKSKQFAELCQHLQWQGDGDRSYAESGERLGISEGAVKVAVFRLRKRYRERVREEVAGTLAEGEDLESEITYLFSVLAL